MTALQQTFINKEIWILTFGGAFQRAGIYSGPERNSDREQFRKKVRDEIEKMVSANYVKAICNEEDHYVNLESFSNWTKQRFGTLLKGGKLNIGVTQKLINLYLKYLWCLDLIPQPPHCPLDRIILSEVYSSNEVPAWTQINSIDDYRKHISAVKSIAGSQSLAMWELEIFSRR